MYIGFGSITVDCPEALTVLIFEAVSHYEVRALVPKRRGGLDGADSSLPENIFMLGNYSYDWLFQKVSCVVYHGTTAAGIACGRPTVIVLFFGGQPFWGEVVSAGARPYNSFQATYRHEVGLCH